MSRDAAREVPVLVVQHDLDSGLGALEVPLRRAGVRPRIVMPYAGDPAADAVSSAGVILLGGHADPDEMPDDPVLAAECALVRACADRGVPVLGICLGAELIAAALGGSVDRGYPAEHGWTRLDVAPAIRDDPVFADLRQGDPAFQWHSRGPRSPQGARVLARRRDADQVFRVAERVWGVHFHIELDMTMAALWCVAGAGELREAGLDPEEVRAETAARDAYQRIRASRIARRFAAVARAYAAGAPSGAGRSSSCSATSAGSSVR